MKTLVVATTLFLTVCYSHANDDNDKMAQDALREIGKLLKIKEIKVDSSENIANSKEQIKKAIEFQKTQLKNNQAVVQNFVYIFGPPVTQVAEKDLAELKPDKVAILREIMRKQKQEMDKVVLLVQQVQNLKEKIVKQMAIVEDLRAELAKKKAK